VSEAADDGRVELMDVFRVGWIAALRSKQSRCLPVTEEEAGASPVRVARNQGDKDKQVMS